jgi:Uma2 family endonuclease
MATNPQHLYLTVEEYLELDRNSPDVRYEYINGRVIMMAGGSPQHSLIAANVTRILGQLLRESPCCVFNSDVKISLPTVSSYVYADVAISCDQSDFTDPEYIYHPCVIIEVLSPSTEILDRGEKFECYRECSSIQEYVMVNTSRLAVEVCRREKNNFWSFQTFKPGATVELTSLGVRFSVSDVYEKVVFPGNNNQPA